MFLYNNLVWYFSYSFFFEMLFRLYYLPYEFEEFDEYAYTGFSNFQAIDLVHMTS